jgi:hypothetical protein
MPSNFDLLAGVCLSLRAKLVQLFSEAFWGEQQIALCGRQADLSQVGGKGWK